MVAVLIIIIVILVVVLMKNKADQNSEVDKNFTNITSRGTSPSSGFQSTLKPVQKPVQSYWDRWKTNNPQKAKAIESSLIDRDLKKLHDFEIKEIIDSFTRMSHANDIPDWNDIKSNTLATLNRMVDALGEHKAFSMLESGIEEEVAHTHAKRENTAIYIGMSWLKEAMKEAKESKRHFSSASATTQKCSYLSTPSSDELSEKEKEDILSTFKTEYKQQLDNALGDNANIPLFCEGYDSPIAREFMHVMYSYARNMEFVNKAKKDGLWNKMVTILVEETNAYTDKYCDADVQECIEYYNFPDKPVKTSRRCPCCGNRDVSYGFSDNEFECMECGNTWFAAYGRNLYL